jgi:hypothetical protein
MNNYKIEPSKLSRYSNLPIDVMSAGSPKTALNLYLKKYGICGNLEKMTSSYISKLLDQGFDNSQIIGLTDFMVELIDNDNPISGNTMWHIV